MKTTITILHANRRGLTHVLSLIQTELSQGFTQSSGKVPAKEPDMVGQLPPAAYVPGFPVEPIAPNKPCNRRAEDKPEPVELDPTSYSYEVME